MKGFAYSGGAHRELSALGLTRDVQRLVLVGFVFSFSSSLSSASFPDAAAVFTLLIVTNNRTTGEWISMTH